MAEEGHVWPREIDYDEEEWATEVGEEQQEGEGYMWESVGGEGGQQEGEGEDITEYEEEKDIMVSESEGEEEEEEAEQLEEMKPPVVTSWMGPDGIIVHGIICINDDVIRLQNRCQHCSICYKPSTTHGKHQICCLPCGHMYGFSCIKKWLLLSSSSGQCPRCKTFCSFQDAILLYPPRLCITAHQKESSAACFPFTKQGFHQYKEYEDSQTHAAKLLWDADVTHLNTLVAEYNDSVSRLERLERAKEVEERAESLGPQVKALTQRTHALERLVSALRRRTDALKQRSDAYQSRTIFYVKMYDAHHERKEEKKKGETRSRCKNLAASFNLYITCFLLSLPFIYFVCSKQPILF